MVKHIWQLNNLDMELVPRHNVIGISGCNSAEECLLPKQDVVGSNPITRSSKYKEDACLAKMSVDTLLTRCALTARTEGLSQQMVNHVKRVE